MSQYFLVDSCKIFKVNEEGKLEVCYPIAFVIILASATLSFFSGALIAGNIRF